MRFTYSETTRSEKKRVLFSISVAYILPILISVSVEYQLPRPLPPMSRLPTALTSSMLPGLTFCFWLPTSTIFNGSTLLLAATSPETGSVPAGQTVSLLSLSFLSFLSFLCLSFLSAEGTQAGVSAEAVSFLSFVAGSEAEGGVSPVTGTVPGGTGWADGGAD